VFIQTINILIVNQSLIDLCASLLTLLTAVVEVNGTRMSRHSAYDQFVCRIWLTRIALWSYLVTSTYGILITAFERYIAVIHPIWYSVSTETKNFSQAQLNTTTRRPSLNQLKMITDKNDQ